MSGEDHLPELTRSRRATASARLRHLAARAAQGDALNQISFDTADRDPHARFPLLSPMSWTPPATPAVGAPPPPPPPPPMPARRSGDDHPRAIRRRAGGLDRPRGDLDVAVVDRRRSRAATCVYPEPARPAASEAAGSSAPRGESPLGYSFRYNAERWTVAEQDDARRDTPRLAGREDTTLRTEGSAGTTPETASRYVGGPRARVPDLTEDRRAFLLRSGPRSATGTASARATRATSARRRTGTVVTMSAMASQVGDAPSSTDGDDRRAVDPDRGRA